jgi:hypothetical protein
MPTKVKSEPRPARVRESSTVSLLSEWVQQGTESFFATQRILLDLVMRQNANTVQAVKERFAGATSAPAAALTEMAGEGISNFIAAQRVLLHLAQRENELIMTGVKERAGGMAPVAVMSDLLRRSVDTFIDMHQHFLTIAAKQTDLWIDATKSGEPFEGKGLAELAREGMDNFVRSQKKFLDIVAEETENATQGHPAKTGKKTELTELAREGVEAFMDAQKKLLDVAAQQMSVNVKVARRAADVVNPLHLPVRSTFADLTRQTVDSFVAAQKALLDVMAKPGHTEPHNGPPRKPPVHKHAAAPKHAHTAPATA